MPRGRTWEVGAVGLDPVVVEAPNWLAALGLALAEIDPDAEPGNMALERLSTGTAVAHDFSTHRRYVVRPRGAGAATAPRRKVVVGPGHPPGRRVVVIARRGLDRAARAAEPAAPATQLAIEEAPAAAPSPSEAPTAPVRPVSEPEDDAPAREIPLARTPRPSPAPPSDDGEVDTVPTVPPLPPGADEPPTGRAPFRLVSEDAETGRTPRRGTPAPRAVEWPWRRRRAG